MLYALFQMNQNSQENAEIAKLLILLAEIFFLYTGEGLKIQIN
jgi:hypothetical protein